MLHQFSNRIVSLKFELLGDKKHLAFVKANVARKEANTFIQNCAELFNV